MRRPWLKDVPVIVMLSLLLLAAQFVLTRGAESKPGLLYLYTVPSGAAITMPQAASVGGMNTKLLTRSPGPLPISIEERSRFNFNLVLFGFQDMQVYLTREELLAAPTYELIPRWGYLSHLLYQIRDYIFLWLLALLWSLFWLLRIQPQRRVQRLQEALWSTGQVEVGMLFHQYRLLKLLGEGAAGAVYKADKPDEKSGEFYTLKIFHGEPGQGHEKQEAALRREFQNAAQLTHPGIVYLLDWGVLENYYYLVSEYVDGVPLDEVSGYGLTEVCLWGSQIAAALGYAHSQGVVHRDIKPANLLLSAGQVKILDFGIAAKIHSDSERGAGTIGYMAPEQAGGTVSPASDFYSLGVTLYRLASGEMPFQGDDHFQILAAQGLGRYKPLVELLPGCPKELEMAIDGMLRHDPSERLTDLSKIGELLRVAANRLNP